MLRIRGADGTTATGSPAVLPVVLPSVVIALLVILRHPVTVDTSDSTAQQSLLRTWLDHGHLDAYLPPDTWVLKLPFYLLVETLPVSPHGKLLADALILNLLTFVVLGWAVWRLAAIVRPRWPEVTAPLVWLAALGGGIGSNRMLLNYRNIELGLSFACLALAAGYLSAGRRPVWPMVPFAVALSVFWLDDPYFALLVGVPFVLACVLWYAFRSRSASYLLVAACVVVSLALVPAWHAVFARLGFHVASTGEGVSLNPVAWWHDLSYLGSGIAVQIGVDHGSGFLFQATRVFLLTALAAAVVASVGVAWHGWRNRRFVICFAGVHWPLVVAAYLASSTASQHGSSRYLILAVYDLAVCLALALPLVRRRRPWAASGLVAVLLIGAALNVTATARSAGGPRPALTVARTQQLQAVLSTGLNKGYGQFWSGNVLIYLSGGKVTVNALRCTDGKLVYDSWLTDTARYQRVRASSTFLIWEPSVPYFHGCSRASVDALLGPPSSELPAGAGSTVLVYPYDIGPRLLGWSVR
jgi:hypothetical protein